MRKTNNVKADMAVVSGITDKGWEIPRDTYSSLTNKPTNITEAMLKATENRMVSNKSISLRLNSLRSANPGIKERKVKTMISLKKGMPNRSEIFETKTKSGIIKRSFFKVSSTRSFAITNWRADFHMV